MCTVKEQSIRRPRDTQHISLLIIIIVPITGRKKFGFMCNSSLTPAHGLKFDDT